MTRRLVVALLGFTTVVLLLSIVPLGLATGARDRSDYTARTRSIAQSLGTLAEESFDDSRKPLDERRLTAAAGPGVSAAVVDAAGAIRVQSGPRRVFPAALVAAARSGATTSVNSGGYVIAAAPVVADGVTRGVVIVARPDGPVDRRVTHLWLALAGVAAAALLLSVALAVGTAGWVGRPLRRLQTAAERWSDGSLHERADPTRGPPEIRTTSAALNVMAARLDTLVHGSRAVVADVSHQLRTPLAAMRLRLELLRTDLNNDRPDPGRVGPAGDDDLGVALGELDRLSRLVDGLLLVARAESAESRPEPVNVTDVVRERRLAWHPVAEERGVQLRFAAPEADVVASITPGQLEQILDNLLDNSLEVMADGGHIDLRVDGHGEHVSVEVSDDGPGMTEDQQQAAFHRFVTGRVGIGFGLGLAVVHRLVTADGGTVRLSSSLGVGTTVTVELPSAR
jgi:signal transduction histidine kinase